VKEFPDLERRIGELGRHTPIDDVHDAYALLWSARRWGANAERVIPAEPEFDIRGLRAEMVA
jgi:predicted RNase H-like nuclease